jgi:hypothetical protein
MAIINDPDLLNQATEITINSALRTLTLNIAGNLSTDGVTLQAMYSFLKEEWKNDPTLIPFPFPMVAITPEQFEFVDDWVPGNDSTRKLIRTGGWAEVNAATATTREYLGVITLGNIDAGDTAYYAFASDTAKTDFTYDGAVNEAIQSFGDVTNGSLDKRSDVLTLFIRQQGKTYAQVTTTEIGVGIITNKVERFPLSETTDLKITASDVTISSTTPYTGMSIEFFALAQTQTMGATNYDFGVTVNANAGTADEVYEYIQYQLRQDADINVGIDTVNGLLADAMAQFVGDRLDTLFVTNIAGGGGGVFVAAINSISINSVRYIDNLELYRTFPFVAAGTINFSTTLTGDSDAVYRMFFTSVPGGNFGTSAAITVQDADNIQLAGLVSGQPSISFTFDYDANVQGTRTAGTDADVTLVAIGLDNAQYVLATGTIARSTANTISVVSALERNYANPV